MNTAGVWSQACGRRLPAAVPNGAMPALQRRCVRCTVDACTAPYMPALQRVCQAGRQAGPVSLTVRTSVQAQMRKRRWMVTWRHACLACCGWLTLGTTRHGGLASWCACCDMLHGLAAAACTASLSSALGWEPEQQSCPLLRNDARDLQVRRALAAAAGPDTASLTHGRRSHSDAFPHMFLPCAAGTASTRGSGSTWRCSRSSRTSARCTLGSRCGTVSCARYAG